MLNKFRKHFFTVIFALMYTMFAILLVRAIIMSFFMGGLSETHGGEFFMFPLAWWVLMSARGMSRKSDGGSHLRPAPPSRRRG